MYGMYLISSLKAFENELSAKHSTHLFADNTECYKKWEKVESNNLGIFACCLYELSTLVIWFFFLKKNKDQAQKMPELQIKRVF